MQSYTKHMTVLADDIKQATVPETTQSCEPDTSILGREKESGDLLSADLHRDTLAFNRC